jgi:succinyl-CoA synthetase beta subunit
MGTYARFSRSGIMVRLHEYQGKQVLSSVKIPVPAGRVASTPAEAKSIAAEIKKPVAVKAQVWVTGRFSAGGIKFANTPEEAEKAAQELIGAEIKGLKVEKVLVEEKLDVAQEFYVGVIVDPGKKNRAPIVIFSSKGGTGVEEIAQKYPQNVAQMPVDVSRGIRGYDALDLVLRTGLTGRTLTSIAPFVTGLYNAFVRADARAAEINPLVITKDGKVYAADCRISVDDNSVFRHPEFGIKVARETTKPTTELDELSWRIEEGDYRGNSYLAQMIDLPIKQEGVIGYHGIGGGGAILGVDALNRSGLKIATYTDTSGNPTASKCYRIAKLILSIPGIEGYMLGGFIYANQEQWHHAHGIVKALREMTADKPGFPALLLICGNKEAEAIQIFKEGLSDMPIRMEVYGGEHVYDADFLAQRMKAMIEEYRKERRA